MTGLSPLETLRVAQSSFAKVVKNRKSTVTVFGLLNMRKAESPWQDIRLRRAVNLAINRGDLITYAANGNGVIVPALVPAEGFGHPVDLAPYPFDPDKSRELVRDAGYGAGLPVTLIAPPDLATKATVIGKMLEQVGLRVESQILDANAFNRATILSDANQRGEQERWDIALISNVSWADFPPFDHYETVALDGTRVFAVEQPGLRTLRDRTLRTTDRDRQQGLIREMERHVSEHAYFLFLYQPVDLAAVNKAVEYVPYPTYLMLVETSVTDQHWSVRRAVRK